jgi:hypothetical protein
MASAGTSAGGNPVAAGGAGPSAAGSGPSQPLEGEVLFSDDFESDTVGEPPSGWGTFIAWQQDIATPPDDNFARVEDVEGSKVVHFMGGTNPAQITRALPPGTNKIYVTARIKMTRQLGQNPGANHETLIGIRGTSGGANDEVRFGEIKGVIGTNEVPSDNISPLMDQWGMGPVLPADTWACFEVGFVGDQPQNELYAWIDGELVHSITSPDDWQNGPMPANWLDGKFTEVILGWHSFSSENIEVWIDDVIVATGRRGCP